MKLVIATALATIAIATTTAIGGYVVGHSSTDTITPKGLHMTLTTPITLTANLITGEWECSNNHGTIKTITAYVAERDGWNIVSERSAAGNMVSLNPTDTIKACHGYTN